MYGICKISPWSIYVYTIFGIMQMTVEEFYSLNNIFYVNERESKQKGCRCSPRFALRPQKKWDGEECLEIFCANDFTKKISIYSLYIASNNIVLHHSNHQNQTYLK